MPDMLKELNQNSSEFLSGKHLAQIAGSIALITTIASCKPAELAEIISEADAVATETVRAPLRATEIASLSTEAQFTINSSEFWEEEKILSQPISAEQTVEYLFDIFKTEIQDRGVQNPTFGAFGIHLETTDGPLTYTFFTADGEDGEELMVHVIGIATPQGAEFHMAFLDSTEIIDELGNPYQALVLYEDPYTQQDLAEPIIVFAFPYSKEEWAEIREEGGDIPALFSPFGATKIFRDQFVDVNISERFTRAATPEATGLQEWDMGDGLPEIHSENARVEVTEFGASIIFGQEGKEYEIEIPNPEGEIIDIAANSAKDGKIRVQLFDKAFESLLAETPEVAFGISGEEQLAWYNLETGEWTKRYEVYFEHDGNYPDFTGDKLFDDEGGYIWHEETDSLFTRSRFAFGGRLKRVIVENYKDKDEGESTFWASMTYGNGEKLVHIQLFSKNEQTTEYIELTYGSNTRSPKYSPESGLSQGDILEALKNNSYIQVNISIFKDGFSGPIANNARRLARAVALFVMFGEEQKLFEEGIISGEYSEIPDDVRLGYRSLWVMLP